MPYSPTAIAAAYPLPAYNFRVTVGGTAMSFAEVAGLKQEYDPVSYRHGLSQWTGPCIQPGMPKALEVQLKRGLVRGDAALADWMNKTYGDPFYGQARRDLVIDLCNESGVALVSWTILGALPVALELSPFSAASNELAIETLRLSVRGIRVGFQRAPGGPG